MFLAASGGGRRPEARVDQPLIYRKCTTQYLPGEYQHLNKAPGERQHQSSPWGMLAFIHSESLEGVKIGTKTDGMVSFNSEAPSNRL